LCHPLHGDCLSKSLYSNKHTELNHLFWVHNDIGMPRNFTDQFTNLSHVFECSFGNTQHAQWQKEWSHCYSSQWWECSNECGTVQSYMWLVAAFWEFGWIVCSFVLDTHLELGMPVAEYFTNQIQGHSLGNIFWHIPSFLQTLKNGPTWQGVQISKTSFC